MSDRPRDIDNTDFILGVIGEPLPPRLTPNQKYGITEIYHHDFDGASICKKCHKPASILKLKVCAVVSKAETEYFRD